MVSSELTAINQLPPTIHAALIAYTEWSSSFVPARMALVLAECPVRALKHERCSADAIANRHKVGALLRAAAAEHPTSGSCLAQRPGASPSA